jgi:hypothetical protein
MVTFKESLVTSMIRNNKRVIMGNFKVCKLMFDSELRYSPNTSTQGIYILSTTDNPFLFTFKTI